MTVSSFIASSANADVSSCTVPTGSGLQQNLNTTLGCDVIEGTSLMSGYISDSGLSPNQAVTFEDAYEGLSSGNFYFGSYTLALNCSNGSANPAVSSYVIDEGTGSYPLTVPTVSSGTLPVVTADSNGNIVCTYLLTAENAPAGHLNSSKSDLWIVAGGSAHTATVSVKPPVLTDPSGPPTDPPTVPTTTPTLPTLPPPASNTTDPTSTTAPPLQTATVSDPSNSHTYVYDPTNTTVGDPSSGSPTTAAPIHQATPSTPATFNPHGLSALAFTGSISEELAVIGLALIVAGGLIVGFGRRLGSSRP